MKSTSTKRTAAPWIHQMALAMRQLEQARPTVKGLLAWTQDEIMKATILGGFDGIRDDLEQMTENTFGPVIGAWQGDGRCP